MNETLESDEHKLPTLPGVHLVSVKDYLSELFELDSRVAADSPDILPLNTPEELLDFLTKEHDSETYVMIGPERELTGYISIIVNTEDPAVEVLNIGTDPEFQSRGFGTKMMLFAEEIARKAGKSKMKLVTTVSNKQAQKFYLGLDYKITGSADRTYDDGKPRYLLEKELGA